MSIYPVSDMTGLFNSYATREPNTTGPVVFGSRGGSFSTFHYALSVKSYGLNQPGRVDGLSTSGEKNRCLVHLRKWFLMV